MSTFTMRLRQIESVDIVIEVPNSGRADMNAGGQGML